MTKHWTNDPIVVGDEVSYRSVSLWQRRGRVIDITPAWAMVVWNIQSGPEIVTSREWLPNLQAWREIPSEGMQP